MPAPSPMECSFPECQFSTPQGVPTFELVIKALEIHVQTAHSQRNQGIQAKAERPTRPNVKLGMNESDWDFFLHEWERYSRQTGLIGQSLCDELWSCMESELRQLAFNEGTKNDDPEQLLQRMKCLAVTTLHPSVHIVTLHHMKQDEGELTKTFAARVKGAAKNCQLSKKCQCQNSERIC